MSNAEPPDILLRLQRTRMRLERNTIERAALINTIAHGIDEIERLRRANELLRNERQLIERAFGKPARMGGFG